jgi:UDP-N-acetylglucosamine acyltransferase
MTTQIHPTAVIADGAQIGDGCKIGPYCVIGAKVRLGARCVLHSHVVIDCNATIGEECEIFPFASLNVPQDLKFKGEDSRLVIGNRNKIREYATLQSGTAADRMETTIGNNCLFMASTHVGHDSIIGNNVILANCATVAGHVTVGDFAFIGGLSAVQQRVRIGHNAMIGGMSAVENDVIPYGLVMGERASLAGLNFVGLERSGVDKSDVQILRAAYKKLFEGDGTLAQRIEALSNEPANNNLVENVLKFLKGAKPGAPLCQPKRA